MLNDVVLEIIRAAIVVATHLYLIIAGKRLDIYEQKGWIYITAGFGFLAFATLIDITDNFDVLNEYIVIGDTKWQAFLEKIVGYLFGFLLVALGFFQWMTSISNFKITQKKLEETRNKLSAEINNATSELKKKIETLERVNEILIERESKMYELKEEITKLKNNPDTLED